MTRAFDPAFLEAMLKNISGVTRVRFNPGAATVVVGYDGNKNCREKNHGMYRCHAC